MKRPSRWTVLLLVLSIAAVAAGSALQRLFEHASLIGWSAGLLLLFLAAFAAARVFSSEEDEP